MLRHPFLVVPIGFYLYTCAPTIGLGDTAMLIDGIQRLHLSTHANSHNVTVLIGWLFALLPIDNIAFKANLMSVTVGSGTVIGFYCLMQSMFSSTWVATITASCLMVSHSMWWHSSLTEVYAVNGAFTVAALALLWRLRQLYTDRRLYLLYLVAALSLFNHVQMGILAIAATVILVARMWDRMRADQPWLAFRLLGICSMVFALGLLPFVLTYASDVLRSGWEQASDSMRGSSFKSIMFQGELWPASKEIGFLVFQQFPSPFLVAVLAGIVLVARAWQGSASLWALATIFVVNTLFFMFYNTWDRFAFLLPSFIILAFAGGFAVDAAWRWIRGFSGRTRSRRSGYAGLFSATALALVLPVYLYSQMSAWGQSPGFWSARYGNAYTHNTHDAARYIADPNKRDYYEIEIFANRLFERLPANAIFIDDDSRTYYSLMYYQRYYQQRQDVQLKLINSWGFADWGDSVPQFGSFLEDAYRSGQPLFLVTVDWPFKDFLNRSKRPNGERYRFHRFALDDRRWVYRLMVHDRQSASLDPFERLPHMERMITGLRFDQNDAVERTHFKRLGARVMTAISFLQNDHSFPIHFEWRAPDSSTPYFASRPFRVTPDSQSLWSALDKTGGRVPGEWTVRAVSGPHILLECRFTLSDSR